MLTEALSHMVSKNLSCRTNIRRFLKPELIEPDLAETIFFRQFSVIFPDQTDGQRRDCKIGHDRRQLACAGLGCVCNPW